jgi:hypothetical protein
MNTESTSYNGANGLCSTAALNTHGLYFTGLSLQTTLAITLNCFVERFPGPQETDLVVLAKPSPQYDLLALEIYSHALHDMPPGVMVKENGLGEWFADVIGKVNNIFGGSLRSLPNPYAQAAGWGMQALDSAAQTFSAPPNAKVGAMSNSRDARDQQVTRKQQKKMNRNRVENHARVILGQAPPVPPRRRK